MYSLRKLSRGVCYVGACAFVMLAFSATVRAVDPPPDGGYPNQNTAEGEDALFAHDARESLTDAVVAGAPDLSRQRDHG